jgi:hypothetical protein
MPGVLIIHSLLSQLDPVFAIDEAEARSLAEAWAGYLRHTNIASVNPRTRDLGVLVMTMLAIEGPRCTRALAHRRDAAKRESDAKQAGQIMGNPRVVPMDTFRGI